MRPSHIGIAEIAGLEIAGLDNDRLEFGGLENDGLYMIDLTVMKMMK